MELLLWMWLYDSRWFFNYKVSIKLYKWIWSIPLLMHLIISILGLYDLFQERNNYTCENSLKIWLLCRIFFSLILSLNIMVFMHKISSSYLKENSFFENAKRVFPYLNEYNNDYDFWIKRNSLISTSGIFLLILGFISLFWSYLIMNMYFYENKFMKCGEFNDNLLKLNSIFVFIGNIPLILVVIILISVKFIVLSSAFLCPNLLILYAKLLNRIKSGSKD